MAKSIFTFSLTVIFTFILFPVSSIGGDEEECVTCHATETPGIVGQWKSSKHSEADISCTDCHSAGKNDVDAFEHYGSNISVIVSPLDCAECHDTEYEQQRGSHHAKAAQILGSLDNFLGEVIGGQAAVVSGCRQCHGSIVAIDENGKPTADTWPNTGMGRINPDGSLGSCSACHARHEFSVRQARQPEACGKCHLGPDHPQIEVWNESKHGILYHANRENMNLDAEEWRAGIEYFTGPTCSSCHMSAAGNQEVTHDVGERISWTLRPPISKKLNMIIYTDGSKKDILGENPSLPEAGSMHNNKTVESVLPWKSRRAKMQEVCSQCHNMQYVKSAYTQIDNLIVLYNEKFAMPAKLIMDELRERGKISKGNFDDPIEWTWYELWHHEGRRARHGVAMQGPDYTWWHGLYEVGKHFYTKFLPELEQVAGKKLYKKLLEKYVYTHPGHQWHRDGMDDEDLKKIREFYEERYDQ